MCAINVPNNDLQFLKDLNPLKTKYQKIFNKTITQFFYYLQYLSEETAGFTYFENKVAILMKE